MTLHDVRLSSDDLAARAAPSVDRRGVRFEHEGRILRALRGDDAAFFRRLLHSPLLEEVFQAGLLRFHESNVRVDGFDLVIESERVPIVSYPQEWPTAMLREAGLTIARLGRALGTVGAGLLDAHPWNVLFDDTRAVWIDLGSVAPLSRVEEGWIREFRRHVALPLAIRSMGWHSMADLVWRDHPGTGIKTLWEPLHGVFPLGYGRLARGSRTPATFFERLEAHLIAGEIRARPSEWSNYVQAPGVVVGDSNAYDPKQRAVDCFLQAAPAGLVLDVGANAGWFSELAARHGFRVIALDTDDVTLSHLYGRARAGGLPILPLRMDAMWPTGSHGMGLAYPAAPARLRAETTLWLAVLHHLVGRQRFSFESVARSIDQFTRQVAIVEFIPREDRHVRAWQIASEPWYDADHFINAMRPFFPQVDMMPSSPEPRVMLCFRR